MGPDHLSRIEIGEEPNMMEDDLLDAQLFSITLGIVLMQPGQGTIDHPIAFASIKLSTVEKNYTTIEREGLAMVYALQKFIHYLLGGHFKMYTDDSALKYLVNKPMLGGNIC